jgi:hypothetical protein
MISEGFTPNTFATLITLLMVGLLDATLKE